MSNLNKLDFTPLDTTGIGYHKWVRDVRNHLKAKGIISAIREPPAAAAAPAAATAPAAAASDDAADATPAQVAARAAVAAAVARAAAEVLEAKNAKAIILMIRHMDESLQSEYLNEEDPRKLWVALEERFGNVRESLLPDLEVKWLNLRFCDYSSVLDFNSEALRIKSLMEFCQKTITDAMLIEKTLSTFPVSDLVVAKNYRIEVLNRRITRFHELISALSVAEKHEKILVKNYNARPVGTKAVPETHYSGAPKGGRRERNPKPRDNSGRPGPYNRSAQEGSRRTRRGGGRDGRPRGNGAAGPVNPTGANAVPLKRVAPRARNATQSKDSGNSPTCFRCGQNGHWAKTCRAPVSVANAYKLYREATEVHNLEQEFDEENVKLRVEDFKAGKNDETPDFA
ncbi:hypothetical protein M0R45_018195 [Rubus argutus]|uniref:CCHC-type domain-containing protein n=1 Tax=Rubus argutus TaxID=59490 RepID=A0AAW1X1R5_RUBAR